MEILSKGLFIVSRAVGFGNFKGFCVFKVVIGDRN